MTFCLFTCMLYIIYSLPKKKLMYKIIYITFHSIIQSMQMLSFSQSLCTYSLTHSLDHSLAHTNIHLKSLVRFTIFALSAGSQPAHNQYWKSREPDPLDLSKSREPDPLTLKGQGGLVLCFSNKDYVQTGNQQTIQKWSIG